MPDPDLLPKWNGRRDAKLSGWQKIILADLYESYDPLAPDVFGARLKPPPEGWTASDRASYSRALRRLELRGLILRQNVKQGAGKEFGYRTRSCAAIPHNRATHVQF